MSRSKRGTCQEGARRRGRRPAWVRSGLKSERVQLELRRADGVRKVIQRGDRGRFAPARVVAAELGGLRVAVLVEVLSGVAAVEVEVAAPPGAEIRSEEVSDAAA